MTTDPTTTDREADPSQPTWVSTASPTAAIASPPPITYAGRTRCTIRGARFDPTMKPIAEGTDQRPACSGDSPTTSCRYWATNRK